MNRTVRIRVISMHHPHRLVTVLLFIECLQIDGLFIYIIRVHQTLSRAMGCCVVNLLCFSYSSVYIIHEYICIEKYVFALNISFFYWHFLIGARFQCNNIEHVQTTQHSLELSALHSLCALIEQAINGQYPNEKPGLLLQNITVNLIYLLYYS